MKPLNQYTHIFFDMDGTVTRSRTRITPGMKEALESLMASGRDVIIISGQGADAIRDQVGSASYFLGQNGNDAIEASSGVQLWKEVLSDEERQAILDHIASLPRDWEIKDENDLVHDRGSQIGFSFLGFNEDIERKEAFDPTGALRKQILKEHPLVSDTVEVKIGGTTTLDYIKKGYHKGFNIEKLIIKLQWDKADCLYIGDALFPGGNDEAVIGVIDTLQVAGPEETMERIKDILR